MVIRNTVKTLRNSLVVSSAGQDSGEVELGHDSNGEDKALEQEKLGQKPGGCCYYRDTRSGEVLPKCIRSGAAELHKATL